MNAVAYLNAYQSLKDALPGTGLPWLQALRQEALAQFSATGFPSPRDEEWKYTNITALEKKRFAPLMAKPLEATAIADLEKHRLADAWVLAIVDGYFVPALSNLEGLPEGVVATGLSDALDNYPERVETLLGAALGRESHGFVAFNTAYFSDGAFIDIPAGTVLEKPLQILQLATRAESLANTRNLVSLAAHAEATLVETFAGVGSPAYLTAAITEIQLSHDASLRHYRLQLESDKAYHFGGVYVNQERSSRLHQHNLAFGGLLARAEIHAQLSWAAEAELNGLFLAKGRQHLDTHTLIHHIEPHGTSRETYRGVLADRARGVFQGRIVVHPQAQKTHAEMSNRNLLLSDDAEIDSKPQLEILTDDVKCSHGVAVGQLDAESVFYLVSRGIEQETAKNMLTFAFANEMVEKIGLESLRGHVQGHLLDLFPQTGIRRDWL